MQVFCGFYACAIAGFYGICVWAFYSLPYGFTSNVAPLQVFVVLETRFASFAAHARLKQQRLLTSLGYV